MKFSITLALCFTGLATASPLLVREPQQFNDDDLQINDFSLPDVPLGPVDTAFNHPDQQFNDDDLQINDFSLPDVPVGPLDTDFAHPIPVDNGPKNSKGVSKDGCDDIRQNHPGLVAEFGCNEFN
ncbi:hypothetical protein ACQRIT_005603 [Beauveria bassiana]